MRSSESRMSRIIEYQVVVATGDNKQLNQRVNALIQQGFQPFGGVSEAVDNQVFYYTQAMVKYENDSQPGGAAG